MHVRQLVRESAEHTARMALVTQLTDSAVAITDPLGVIEWVNPAFCVMTGYPVEEAVGVTRASLFPSGLPPTQAAALSGAPAGQPQDMELLTASKQGRRYWVSIEVRPMIVAGEVVQLFMVERDVSPTYVAEEQMLAASRRAEQLAADLSAEKTLLAEVISSIPHLVYWKDLSGCYRGVNNAFVEQRGLYLGVRPRPHRH